MLDIWTEKYRPQKLDEIVGQEPVIKRLKSFVESKHLPHLLFAGKQGVGKTTAALCLANELFGRENRRSNFLELNASDERGIDTIRIKIKDFARTRPIGEVPFKIIYLDEADALTRDAQQALRRTMEMYSEICKFILACNYSSKLIEPIQSRCVVFRFKPISKEDTIKFLDMICQKEKLKYDKEAMEEIAKESMGDLRKAINILQACASLNKHITLKTVLEVTGKAKIEDVEEMLKFALQGDFAKAREKLLFILLDQGIDPDEVIRQIYNRIFEFENLSDKEKAEIMQLLGDYEFRLTEGSNPLVQLEAFLAQLCLRKK